MTDEEDRVRALLSSLPPETMPGDVADRLDATLRAEAATRRDAPGVGSGEVPGATVTPIRRVRRWLPTAAVAAIVLGIVAIALPQLLPGSGPADNTQGSSATSGRRAPDAASPRAGTDSQPDARRSPRLGPNAVKPGPSDRAAPVTLDSSAFAHDVAARVVRRGLAPEPTAARQVDRLRCRDGRLRTSDGLAVTVDGSSARLFASGPADARVFLAVGCSSGELYRLASATLDVTAD